MAPEQFLRTVYLGDRSLVALSLDTQRAILRLEFDLISRIRSSDGRWHFYSDEDIPNGVLAFGSVTRLWLGPSGLLPNDYFLRYEVRSTIDMGAYEFVLRFGSVDDNGDGGQSVVTVVAKDVWIEDAKSSRDRIDS